MQDIYYAEHQIEKALPDMVEKASDAELKKGFRTHLKQTKGQIKRLDQAFKKLKVTPEGTKCPAIDGIIDEAKEIAGEIDDKMVLNAALIAAAQAVEHYEITRYGTLVAWAKLLGRNDVAKVLEHESEGREGNRQKAQRHRQAQDQSQGRGAAAQASGPGRARGEFDVGCSGRNSRGLASAKGVRQHLAHDIRQRLAGEIGDLYPARAFGRRGGARHLRGENCKLKREMREHVTHDAGHAPPSRARKPRSGTQRVCHIKIMRPFSARNFHHRAEQTFGRTAPQQHGRAVTYCDKGSPAAQFAFAFGSLAGKCFLIAAPVSHT